MFRRQRNDSLTTKVGEVDQPEEIDCAVCLCPVSPGEKFRLLTCNHGFHAQCIEAWLRASSTCPLCRNPASPLSRCHRNDHQQRRFF
ncbi:RING-type E3 ubiquitin transferase, partial [Sarracenia purpurea var. burkii]